MTLLTNCTLVPRAGDVLPDAAIALNGETIAWAGPLADLPDEHAHRVQRDLGGRLVTPGLIDCHTHVVHGGHRAGEFRMRLEGASYDDIARAGGGIVSTVTATRAASEDELLATALRSVDALIAEGVTTVEIKSGYGLDQETELKMLRAARAVGEARQVDVVTTFLGAHAVPAEFKGQEDSYIETVCIPALRAAHEEGLVDAVDGFCEGIAFTPAQIARVFDAARALGLPIKLHAEQLSDLGGAAMAAERGAMSVDHLEYLNADDCRVLVEHGTIAVILPGAFYTLRETQMPPIQALRDAGVPMAVATDCNPGSSPMASLLLAMNMCATLFRMTPDECLAGVTVNAAKALGLTDRGEIAAGQRADLCVWDIGAPEELSYRIGFNPLHQRFYKGQPC